MGSSSKTLLQWTRRNCCFFGFMCNSIITVDLFFQRPLFSEKQSFFYAHFLILIIVANMLFQRPFILMFLKSGLFYVYFLGSLIKVLSTCLQINYSHFTLCSGFLQSFTAYHNKAFELGSEYLLFITFLLSSIFSLQVLHKSCFH